MNTKLNTSFIMKENTFTSRLSHTGVVLVAQSYIMSSTRAEDIVGHRVSFHTKQAEPANTTGTVLQVVPAINHTGRYDIVFSMDSVSTQFTNSLAMNGDQHWLKGRRDCRHHNEVI